MSHGFPPFEMWYLSVVITMADEFKYSFTDFNICLVLVKN